MIRSKYRALIDFDGYRKEDLVIKKGDILSVRQKGKNRSWWKAKNKRTKQTGLIPKTFIIKFTDGLEIFEGFYNFSQSDADVKLLQPFVEYGTYLIRPSIDSKTMILSLKYKMDSGIPDICHYPIKRSKTGYYIDKTKIFKFYGTMFQYYSENPILKTKLKTVFLLHSISVPQLDDFEIPQDQIEIKEVIGKGNFGEVFKGLWLEKIDVAIKSIPTDGISKEKFLQEPEIISKMDHPNIMQLIGIMTSQKNAFSLITEYFQNGSITNFFQKKLDKEFRQKNLIHMMLQIADGMKYLISKHIIHRDLRADNVLVANDFSMKISDFGLARFAPHGIYNPKDKVITSWRWTAPEILISPVEFNEKTDVWSYGITAYEIMSRGREPYEGEGKAEEIQENIIKGYTMTFPSDFECDLEIQMTIKNCWKFNADERPTFREILEKIIKHIC